LIGAHAPPKGHRLFRGFDGDRQGFFDANELAGIQLLDRGLLADFGERALDSLLRLMEPRRE